MVSNNEVLRSNQFHLVPNETAFWGALILSYVTGVKNTLEEINEKKI